MKRYLFMMSQAPHQGSLLQERLDFILTTAAFDQQVGLLFIDDGVFQLKQQQQAQHFGLKETLSLFKALALYDINSLYVEVESLKACGLQAIDLALPVIEIYRNDLPTLMREYDILV